MTKEKQIDEIMDWFNFNKVAKTMKALDWKWLDGVPEEPVIRKRARKLLTDLKTDKDDVRGTGGFVAHYTKKEDCYRLEFIVSEWDTCTTKE